MMDLFKVHIFIVAALVAMSHLSTQQVSSTEKPTPAINTTLAPSKVTTVKPDNSSPVMVTDTETKNKASSSVAPLVVTTEGDSDRTKVQISSKSNKTDLKTTTAVSLNNKSNSTNGTQDQSTSQPPLSSASSSSLSGTNPNGTTAAPISSVKSTTTLSPTKPMSTKGVDIQAPDTTTTTTDNSTKNDNVTVAPTTEQNNSTDKNPSTAAPETTVKEMKTTGQKNESNPSPKPTNAAATSPVTTKNTADASTVPVTTDSQNGTSPKVTTTTVPNTETPKTSKTVTHSSEATPTTVVTTQAPAGSRLIYINEIVVDKNGTFQKIELYLSNWFDVTHYAMVIVDGETNKYMAVVNLTDIVQQNRLLLIHFNNTQSSPMVKNKGTGIAIYDTTLVTMSEAWTGEESGLMDALVIGKDYTMISQNLTQTLTPGVNPFVLDPNKYGQNRTISRCSSDSMRSTDMFALTNPSFGYENVEKCHERLNEFKKMAIKISGMDCKLLADLDQNTETSDQLSLKKVLRSIAKEVNKQCRCGLTLMHIDRSDTTVKCCDGASIDMKFVASTEQHLEELSSSYETFINKTKIVVIDNKQYMLDTKCDGHCCKDHKLGPTGMSSDDKAKNVKVTVAVIVCCLVVFSVVVVIVILYMKKKNRAVYQFRMSRLDEEDDLYNDGPDHEDFVGGQEATFDVKRR